MTTLKAGQRRKYMKDCTSRSATARVAKHPRPQRVRLLDTYALERPGDVFLFADSLGVLMCLCGHLITIGMPELPPGQHGSVFNTAYRVVRRNPLTLEQAIRCPRGCRYAIREGAIEIFDLGSHP